MTVHSAKLCSLLLNSTHFRSTSTNNYLRIIRFKLRVQNAENASHFGLLTNNCHNQSTAWTGVCLRKECCIIVNLAIITLVVLIAQHFAAREATHAAAATAGGPVNRANVNNSGNYMLVLRSSACCDCSIGNIARIRFGTL